MKTMKNKLILAALALAALAAASCSNELTNSAAPVELVVTNTQKLHRLDIAAGSDASCASNIGTINMQVIPKNSTAKGPFVQVRVTRYRVSYRRTDGGTLVPAPFVRTMDTLLSVGSVVQGSNFTVFEGGSVNQAPFAALQPQNGGIDPETGSHFVKMDVIVEVFGETLAGDNVYDATAFPLEFCYACGGCA